MENDGSPTLPKVLTAAACSVIALVSVMAAPRFQLFVDSPQSMLMLHLSVELFAVAVSALVVSIAWNTLDPKDSSTTNWLIFGFTAVAILDLVHALVYDGMPNLIAEGSTNRSVFFWVTGRTVESMTLLALALRWSAHGHRNVWFAGSAGLSLIFVWLGANHLDWFPELFIKGQGVTKLKTVIEWSLCALNMSVAYLFWRTARHTGRSQFHLYALSCFMMGLCEIIFADYQTISDFRNLVGHLFKVAAYAVIYWAAVRTSIQEPYRRIIESEKELRESKAQLRSISDNLPNGMIYQMILTPDGGRRFTYVSDTIQRLNGLSVSAVLSDPDLLYAQVIPEDREALAKAERAAAESFSVFEAIVRFRRADGVLRWQRLCSAPRRLENGGIAWDGIAVDVTEAHEAEQRVKQLNIELESRITARTRELTQANLDLDAFAGSVSHDLRAPTRRIASFSQMLRAEAGALSKEAMHKLEVIESEARHMNELIDALLRLARLGRQELVKQPLALDKIVMHVREQLSEAQADRRLEWVVHPLPVIQGDPDLIGQVFHNLIGNAIKFTRQREVGIIEIGALMSTYPLDMCTLFVRDNGAGFDMRYADKLFGAFQRLHSQQEFEGTGVGLANVKKIVERHGGRVWAESSPQGGATFFFTLPVHQALTENTLFVSV